MHTGGDDFTAAQVAGMKQRCAQLGFTIVGITNANFEPSKQVADIESLMALKPSLLITIPTEAQSMAATYAKVAAAGIPIVYGGVRPTGIKRSAFVSLISSDDYGNGIVSGFLTAKVMNKQGNIGTIFWDVSVGTKDRHLGFLKALSYYPDMKVIQQQEIAGPDFETSAQSAANAILTAYPNVQALWTVWDVPAAGAEAAARAKGRNDLIIMTEDLGLDAAVAIAENGLIRGTGAQRPEDMGRTQVNAGAYHLLGKQPPAFIVIPAFAVDRSNVLQAYTSIYGVPDPKALKDAYARG
jgi:ribose transport system substrate-binding protein